MGTVAHRYEAGILKLKTMKNSEQPIHPCIMQQISDDGYRLSKPTDDRSYNTPCAGLTKREYLAGLAMQGLLAGRQPDWNMEDFSKTSVDMADALLEQLKKPKP